MTMNSTNTATPMVPAYLSNASSDIYKSSNFINCMRTFQAYFGKIIPNLKQISYVDHERAIKWVESRFVNNIVAKHKKELYSVRRKNIHDDNILYIVTNERGENALIDIDDNGLVCVVFASDSEHLATEIAEKMTTFGKRYKRESRIHVIVSSPREGLDTHGLKCPKPKLSIEQNYNTDLQNLHPKILKSLRTEKSGLMLFWGVPGSGKSTYIRYLVNSVNKTFIFLSSRMAASCLDDPQFINLLLQYRNSVLVIEDSELLISSRETHQNSAISMLLNLTDGLLGEALSIQILCTFNTQLDNIDEALKRRGRLIHAYEFGPLDVDKSNQLFATNGIPYTTTQPMTLADIYNFNSDNGLHNKPKRAKIGFSAT